MRAVLDLPEEGIDPTLDFIASRYQDPVLRLLTGRSEWRLRIGDWRVRGGCASSGTTSRVSFT